MKSKTTLLVPVAKPRNALVAQSHQRSGAGVHVKSSKALRARDNSSRRRDMDAPLSEMRINFGFGHG